MEKQTVAYLLGITVVATLMALGIWKAARTYRSGVITIATRHFTLRANRDVSRAKFWSLFCFQLLILTGLLLLGSWIIYIKLLQLAE